jgi:hypothetical protein
MFLDGHHDAAGHWSRSDGVGGDERRAGRPWRGCRRRRRAVGASRGLTTQAAALAYATAPAGPQPIPPPPGPEAPPPWQTLTGRAPAKFVAGAGSNVERRTISYRFVKVTDGPDDLRFREIGRLDRGDEVEVIGEQDGMLNVRTATRLVGWVPRVVIVG